MADALVSRVVVHTDLKEHAEESRKQLRASEIARETGLDEEREIFGGSLDVTFSGGAEEVARFVRRCDAEGISVAGVAPYDEQEHELLEERVGGITHVSG